MSGIVVRRGRGAALGVGLAAAALGLPAGAGASFPGRNGVIAHTSTTSLSGVERSQIFTVNPDGTGARQLTSVPFGTLDRDPSFSPDGSQLVFTRSGELRRIRVADGAPLPTTGTGASPSFGPGGGTIAFARGDEFPAGDFLIANADGSGARVVAEGLGDEPELSPDGRRIVYTVARGTGIGVVDADGGNARYLASFSTSAYGSFSDPSWSPDGTRIIYAARPTPESYDTADLYVVNTDGSGRRRVVDDPSYAASPVFSPDGTRIAFTSFRDGNSEIYVANADGTGQTRITFTPDISERDLDWQAVAQAKAKKPKKAKKAKKAKGTSR